MRPSKQDHTGPILVNLEATSVEKRENFRLVQAFGMQEKYKEVFQTLIHINKFN